MQHREAARVDVEQAYSLTLADASDRGNVSTMCSVASEEGHWRVRQSLDIAVRGRYWIVMGARTTRTFSCHGVMHLLLAIRVDGQLFWHERSLAFWDRLTLDSKLMKQETREEAGTAVVEAHKVCKAYRGARQ